MNDDVLIKVENVSKKFCNSLKRSMRYGIGDIARNAFAIGTKCETLREHEFWAIDDVSFELKRGECLGIIGKNGAGKSTLLKILNGIFLPDKGKITIKGNISALIEVGAGFHPMLTGRENIYINGSILGMSKNLIDAKFDEIVAFAELEGFIDSPVKQYSSGMYVRLGFAIAAQVEPDVLLLDEVLAVGDAAFRAKCFDRIGEIINNTAVIFVSHDINQIYRICDQSLYIGHGKVEHFGDVGIGVKKYLKDSNINSENIRIVNAPITNFGFKLDQKTITYNDNLIVNLDVECSYELEIGLFLLNFEDNGGIICAQADCTDLLSKLTKGKNSVTFQLNNINLSDGFYSIHVGIFSKNRKQTLVHIRRIDTLKLDSVICYGPKYQIAACPIL